MNCDVHGHVLRSSYNLTVLYSYCNSFFICDVHGEFGLINVHSFLFCLRNDLYCVGWGVKLYSLTTVTLSTYCPQFRLEKSGIFFVWRVVTLSKDQILVEPHCGVVWDALSIGPSCTSARMTELTATAVWKTYCFRNTCCLSQVSVQPVIKCINAVHILKNSADYFLSMRLHVLE